MTKMLLGNSMWNLVSQADTVTKIVLSVLFFLSILCWAVFFYKLILLRIKKKQMQIVHREMKRVRTLEELLDIASVHTDTLPGYFLTKNLTFLKSLLSTPDGERKSGLSATELEFVQQHADQTIDDILFGEESYLPILSTTAAISPLIGLFGTVWGLVHAFVRISERQSADIATIAPGIAEALITTLAGLVVAIPAFVMYSYCSSRVRKLDRYFTLLSNQFMVLVQRLLVK